MSYKRLTLKHTLPALRLLSRASVTAHGRPSAILLLRSSYNPKAGVACSTYLVCTGFFLLTMAAQGLANVPNGAVASANGHGTGRPGRGRASKRD